MVGTKVFFATLILLCGVFVTHHGLAQTTPDPGLVGTHPVTKAEYDLGDAVYTPPLSTVWTVGKKMEVRGSVHYPSDIATMGPCPVLVWMHGMHGTCYDPSTGSGITAWPCPSGQPNIPSYAGYDYAAKVLASHGFIVISIQTNAINAINNGLTDRGMSARGVLLQHHLDLWNGWNTTVTTGPFGTTFVGKLDMQNIGTMGHSRGGEGVVFNAEYNRSLGSPYGIKAVLTLAPVDFYRHVLNNIPLMDVSPYCDGDVSDLQGVHFYDDARYPAAADETPKHTVLMMGANHDFFNTIWTPGSLPGGGDDDWADYGYDPSDPHCGTVAATRFDTTKQHNAYVAYAAAFYRLYMTHETQFAPILQVTDLTPPASSTLTTSDVYVSYHAGKSDRLDINRIDASSDTVTNTLGGAVNKAGLTVTTPSVCNGGLTMADCDITPAHDQKPHAGQRPGGLYPPSSGLYQMKLAWADTSKSYQNDIPATNQNFTLFQNLTFRASVNFVEMNNAADFSVALIDSAGDSSSQDVNAHTYALFLQQGNEPQTLPKEMFNTIHIPLSSFAGVNLSKIRHVKFKFNQMATGSILITDLALSNPICGNMAAVYTDSIPTNSYKVFFKNKSTETTGDTVSYLWHFGNPTSGVNDTSTLANPTHTYPKPGFYTACLYVTVKRANGLGMVCHDTVCTTVTVRARTAVNTIREQEITIIPNPAKDYLQINGAEQTDVLKLVNVYGQEVFSGNITQPIISLPQTLASGLYYAVILSPRGNVYQKIVILR